MNVLENFFQQKGSDKLKYVLYYVELSKPTWNCMYIGLIWVY
jgi:hypothetical protein